LAEVAPDARVLVSAAVLAIAGASMLGATGNGGGGNNARVAFANVRLLPCLVRASVERHIEALTLALSQAGGAPAAAYAANDGGALRSGTSATSDGHERSSATSRPALTHKLQSLLDSVRGGFDDVVGDARDEAEDGLNDSRLMTQIGMLLGFVYLAFLSVWFWATRGRAGLRA
jgi:hypothetical protein